MPNDEISKQPGYLLFDIEGYPDIDSIVKANHYHDVPRDGVLAKYHEEQRKKIEWLRQHKKRYREHEDWKETAYLPITFQRPLFIAVAKVAADYTFLDASIISALADDPFRNDPVQGAHLVCKRFLEGWRYYKKPVLVTFHGTIFDFPLMKYSAFNYGIDVHDFPFDERNGNKKTDASPVPHIDMYTILSNYGAGRFRDGRKTLAGILGKKEKAYSEFYESYADFVSSLYQKRHFHVLENICLKRILDYYPIFLRLLKLTGGFDADPIRNFDEEKCKASMKRWVEKQIDDEPKRSKTLSEYLEQWGKYFGPNHLHSFFG